MEPENTKVQITCLQKGMSGPFEITTPGWTGTIYRIDRHQVPYAAKMDSLKHNAVYILIFPVSKQGKTELYIGQSNIKNDGSGVISRLKQHLANNKNWAFAIVITEIRDEVLDKTGTSFMEHALWTIFKNNPVITIQNKVEPGYGNPDPAKKAALEEFLNKTCKLLNILGIMSYAPAISRPDTKPILSTQENPQPEIGFLNLINEFIKEIFPKLAWDLVPFTFLYDLYIAWNKKRHPSLPTQNRQAFINAILSAIGEQNTNFWCENKKKSIWTGNRMDNPEPLVTEYGLKNWTNKEPGKNYRGLLRKPNAT